MSHVSYNIKHTTTVVTAVHYYYPHTTATATADKQKRHTQRLLHTHTHNSYMTHTSNTINDDMMNCITVFDVRVLQLSFLLHTVWKNYGAAV